MLAFHYMCNLVANDRPLTSAEVAACMNNYEKIKVEFIDDDPAPKGSVERARQNSEAYRAFKSWEAENAEAVRYLKEELRRTRQTG